MSQRLWQPELETQEDIQRALEEVGFGKSAMLEVNDIDFDMTPEERNVRMGMCLASKGDKVLPFFDDEEIL